MPHLTRPAKKKTGAEGETLALIECTYQPTQRLRDPPHSLDIRYGSCGWHPAERAHGRQGAAAAEQH